MTRRPSDPSVRSVQEDDMPVRPPRRVGRRVAKISLVALASLILLTGLVLGGVALVLTPARLTPLVNEYASRVLNARIGFDTVSLSLVRHFPNVGVRLKGGQIVSRAFEGLPDSLRAEIPAAADTLLRFDEFTLALDLPQLLASRLVVRRIDLRRPPRLCLCGPIGAGELGNLCGRYGFLRKRYGFRFRLLSARRPPDGARHGSYRLRQPSRPHESRARSEHAELERDFRPDLPDRLGEPGQRPGRYARLLSRFARLVARGIRVRYPPARRNPVRWADARSGRHSGASRRTGRPVCRQYRFASELSYPAAFCRPADRFGTRRSFPFSERNRNGYRPRYECECQGQLPYCPTAVCPISRSS